MIRSRINRFSVLVLVCIAALALFSFSACGNAKEKAKDAAKSAGSAALGALEKGAEIAGEATANWLGTTAGNVGKNFNETITERLSYLDISVDSIESEAEEGINKYTLELTVNNTAPDDEKIYMETILKDNYLVACDQDDYTYKLTVEKGEVGYSNTVMPGKSRYTIYTELAEIDEISYLMFIGEKIELS